MQAPPLVPRFDWPSPQPPVPSVTPEPPVQPAPIQRRRLEPRSSAGRPQQRAAREVRSDLARQPAEEARTLDDPPAPSLRPCAPAARPAVLVRLVPQLTKAPKGRTARLPVCSSHVRLTTPAAERAGCVAVEEPQPISQSRWPPQRAERPMRASGAAHVPPASQERPLACGPWRRAASDSDRSRPRALPLLAEVRPSGRHPSRPQASRRPGSSRGPSQR